MSSRSPWTARRASRHSSSALTQTVNSSIVSTTTTLSSSVNPSVFGQSVTFTATVTPASGSGTPDGTVTFFDGAASIGFSTLSGGQATFAISSLAVGMHSITASYGGSSGFTASTSNTVIESVNKATTSTTVTSSANPSVFGQIVTFTATVTPQFAGSTPTGTVAFLDGTSTLGTATLSGGMATFTTSSLAVGTHTIKASLRRGCQFQEQYIGAQKAEGE